MKEENDNIMSASLSAMSLSFSQECFNSPYDEKCFAVCAEPIPGTTSKHLSDVAKECKIYLIGGKEFVFHVYSHIPRPPFQIVCLVIWKGQVMCDDECERFVL